MEENHAIDAKTAEDTFINVYFKASPNIKTTDRNTYDVLNFFGDVGGFIEMLKLIFGLFVGQFSKLRMKALLNNRLFYSSYATRSLESDFEDSRNMTANKLREKQSGEKEIDVPMFLDWEMLREILCCVCRLWSGKQSVFSKYEEALELANLELNAEMDLFRFIRRNRMHGQAL